ncbi:uncharacterized protein LOC111025702 [Momordica charantia]|uniref:Uncharacterized protein LOC111025702 n=1 Tax=Momordica charantia TaxID=3673 RepID=A0A6J1E204_MOMCH|nr:uncharacterized protein LOC111025702 [Momordica charantia]
MWSYVVKNLLISTSYDSSIQQIRVMIVYILMKGIEFNFSELIRNEIWVCAEKMVGPLIFPARIMELCLKAGVEADVEDVVMSKKSATSIRRVRGYLIVREEDSPITAADPDTRGVVTREQYDEYEKLRHVYDLLFATQHATCEFLKKLYGDGAPSLPDELAADLPSSSRPTGDDSLHDV